MTLLLAVGCCNVHADSIAADTWKKYLPTIGGTFRGRFEYDTDNHRGRFAVRNSRLSLRGNVFPPLGYFVQADLCQNGKFSLLDTYVNFNASRRLELLAGQMLVPFSVDGCRPPHTYYFADRSALAKYLGNRRAPGVKARYTIPRTPLYAEGGIFNTTDRTDHSVWQDGFVYSARLRCPVALSTWTLRPEISAQTIKPYGQRITQYDAAVTLTGSRWTIEGECILRQYMGISLADTRACNIMANYAHPLSRKDTFLSAQARWDYMTDCYSGYTESGHPAYDIGKLSRLTAGITYSQRMGAVHADLRINYEHTLRGSYPCRATTEIVAYF